MAFRTEFCSRHCSQYLQTTYTSYRADTRPRNCCHRTNKGAEGWSSFFFHLTWNCHETLSRCHQLPSVLMDSQSRPLRTLEFNCQPSLNWYSSCNFLAAKMHVVFNLQKLFNPAYLPLKQTRTHRLRQSPHPNQKFVIDTPFQEVFRWR